MANVHTPSKRPGEAGTLTLDTTEAGIVLKNNLDPMLVYIVGTCKLSVRGTGWTGAITVKKRPVGTAFSGVTTIYQIGNSDTVVAAGTPISADQEYYVRADMDEIILDYTHTGGSVTVAYGYRVG